METPSIPHCNSQQRAKKGAPAAFPRPPPPERHPSQRRPRRCCRCPLRSRHRARPQSTQLPVTKGVRPQGSSSRSSARHSTSASISTSRGSSQKSESPSNPALDSFGLGGESSSGILSYQSSPMQQQQAIFENSAPHVSESQFVYDGQQIQLTPSYPAWSGEPRRVWPACRL